MLVDKIRALANSKGYSLTTLEKELGFGNGTITRWNKSSPSSEKLCRVADFFGVTVDHLLGRDLEDGFSEKESLEGVYLSLAKDAQESGIDPDDIKAAIDMIKKFRNQE
jgi:transcriptional regulator with XRE-family HTH domain